MLKIILFLIITSICQYTIIVLNSDIYINYYLLHKKHINSFTQLYII